ncbi:hypothetical protein HHL21_00305 [Massilia sp. RP-1-19]|uniref:Uncharacterized protein n=1 Tax=Massilia polaris TaxID=2728846 RepID=A0A848HM31_9BURK|nr:hypothetical protein [Massilia polaris]
MKRSRQAEGFVTPTEDKIAQVHSILPRRVLPIIFLPGIMGSNLRMKPERQRQMGRENNIAWRPDSLAQSKILLEGDAAMRQLQLDPGLTEVDEYDPLNNPTGAPNESADERHDVVEVKLWYTLGVGIDTPLLIDDPITAKSRRTKDQKARERGWGEVFFDSYQELLETCEQRLNTAFVRGRLNRWWKNIVNVPPANWQASAQPPLAPLDEKTLQQAVKDCWFPVHAMGYNWLQSNRDSAVRIAERIRVLIKRYEEQGFQCEKVIVVTDSMGGLVARALIHPNIGNLKDQVLGVVHGVMPATGAGAAYKRMRCGFEDPGINSMSPITSVTAKVLGNFGPEVTAVLGNAQGGLELLPSQAYGDHWLRVTHGSKTLLSLPKKGDPYREIYKVQGKWYSLLREEWLNPAQIEDGPTFQKTCELLDKAKAFHNEIQTTYHPLSFAHYGADPNRSAWHQVVWEIDAKAKVLDIETLRIEIDDEQGKLRVNNSPAEFECTAPFSVTMQAPSDPGDQTVPLHSAEHQLHSGKFKGIFRQSGYEHQDSYKDERALQSTLYSLVRIAQNMEWAKR